MLSKYYSPVHTTTTKCITCPSSSDKTEPASWKQKAEMKCMRSVFDVWRGEQRSSRLCSLLRQKTFTCGSTSLPQTPPPASRLPSRQPRLRNRSLFKSFMSTPQKRKACRRLWDRNEEGVIVPLICDDLRHNACDWFDNQALFPFRRGRKLKSAIPACFLFFFASFLSQTRVSFPSSNASRDFSFFFLHLLSHPNLLRFP